MGSCRSLSSGSASLLAACALFAVSCNRPKDSQRAQNGTAKKIKAIAKVEVVRAKKACEAYVTRVCECAKNHPDMQETCALAKASPSALQLNLDLLASSGLAVVEQKAVKVAARKIAAKCFEATVKLDSGKCPRLAD